MKLNDLRKEVAKLADRQDQLLKTFDIDNVEDRPGKLTNEQIDDEYQTNEKKVKEIKAQIEELERWESRKSDVSDLQGYLNSSAGLASPANGQTGQPEGVRQVGEDARFVHTHRSPTYIDDVRRQTRGRLRFIRGDQSGMGAPERAYRLGMWGLYLAQQCLPGRYSFPRATRFVQEQGMIASHGGGSSDTTGAHVTVPDEFSADLINLKEQRGVVRRLFRRESMATETKTIPRRTSGLTAYAVGENAAGTESNMALDDIQLVARKWMVLTRMSKELDEDNIVNFGDVLAGELAYAFADKEDEAGFNGDGTSTYHGIVGARTRMTNVDGSGTDSGGLVTGAGNAYSELTLANFESVIGTLPQYAAMNPVWVASRTFYWTVMKRVELASGGVTASEITEGGADGRFLGYPVFISQVMPSTEANSQVCCLFGDFAMGAVFGERRADTVEFSDVAYVNSQSVWERDQIAVKGTARWDIKVHEYGSSSAAGAIVGLETASS